MKWLGIALVLVSAFVHADANQDAFNAGASFGKGSKQSAGSLKNADTVSGALPGYTSSPPQADWYGGVTGGDGGLAGKGQGALQGSAAGQVVIDSGTKNPMPVIDPNAPFISAGKNAESTADGVLNDTAQQCKETTVSKSTFEKFICERDAWIEQSCTRSGVPGGAMSKPVVTSEEVRIKVQTGGRKLTVTIPETMEVNKATLYFGSNEKGIDQWGMEGSFINTRLKIKRNVNMPLSLTGTVEAGQVYTSTTFCPDICTGYTKDATADLMNEADVVLILNVTTTKMEFEPSVGWSEACSVNKDKAVKTGSVCTTPGGSRPVTVDGNTYQVTSDCWQYTDQYLVPSGSNGTCGTLMKNPACTVNGTTCQKKNGSYCEHETVSYECQKVWSSSGLVCGGTYFCKSGDCTETDGAGDNGFDTAVAKLAGLASAAEDVKEDQINVRAFTGDVMSCRKAVAGFSNCCKDSGWGSDAGLQQCNSEELALGKAKAKKVTVSIGEKCDHKALGVCLQKSMVYCVFQGKLARIIQEQGRRDQLHVGFGSGDNPNCRGITVPELQSIDFDLINFSDFYEDLMKNQKIPQTDVMVKQIKDRIAAQVNQQQGGQAK
ncbi:type-F conjugative transfer system mating-pair stabilization protein TraN [Cronobacter dublinensis]|uniref:Type-F conjugative transfer system mating-pair stabilization protein TraN n=1 Tax=Cronobacter dublinensis TaxID=413497 RepID=A0A9Q4XTD7_9ENTR|nr:type-F conjugative transfer system mating-pair stabilization protein TraN [Cronobacter dublinensis]NCH89936.1 type-F conjugative transfer system mating-pair stabilization protein TraN [Cronobacter dublinensis]